MTRRQQAVRAGVALLVVGALLALILQDRTSPDRNPDEPVSEDSSAPTPTAEPSVPGPDGPPTDAVPTPPPGIEDLVCKQVRKAMAVRVLSFNTHRSSGSTRGIDAVVEEIKEVDPDIVLLQEVDRFMARTGGRDQAEHLAAAVDMNDSFSANLLRGSGEYGTLILSRFKIVAEGRLPLAVGPGAEPRGLQWVLLSIRGRLVRVYNTHLDAVRPALRDQQAQQVADVASRDTVPVILGGDLNAWPSSGSIAAISSALTDTWQAGHGRAATGRGGHKIDYIFASPRLRPLRSRVLESSVSDHHRLWADLRVKVPKKCPGRRGPGAS